MPREIRDPIHGFIQLDEYEFEIINQPIFQKLRRIKQLALAQLLYPGAMHTRFDHSIGTRFVAGRMGQALGLEKDELQRICRAALLHDLGHGPFSHVSENLLAQFSKPEIIKSVGLEEIHELITMQLIKRVHLSDPECEKIISLLLPVEEQARNNMVKFLRIKDYPPDPILKAIISGPLDADKQDYLLRDSYFCGVKYGLFDIERLHNTLVAEKEPRGIGRTLAITEDGVHSVEQYVMAKYYMNTQVYRHRVRRATDAMLTRAIELGIEKDKIEFLKDLYTYDGSEKFLDHYVKWDDEQVTCKILKRGKGKAYEIFKRLSERRLFKQIYGKRVDNVNFKDANIRRALAETGLSKTQKQNLEAQIGKCLEIEPEHVFVDVYKIRSAKEEVEGMERAIRVKDKGVFHEESTLFRSIDKAMQDKYLEIYAPVHYTTEIDKKKKLRDCENKITDILHNIIGRKKQ